MGRSPCCDKAIVKKGPWSLEEDTKLKGFIEKHGIGGNWLALPNKAGLKRCGKSCRLRWLNYLRPNIKHGEFSDEEDRVICTLFASIGSRWSIIASQLAGRTDNDIKNYWNTKLKKKLMGMGVVAPSQTHYHNYYHHQQQQQQQQQQLVLPSAAATYHQDSVPAACTAPSFLQATADQGSGSGPSGSLLMFGGDLQQSCSYGQGMEYSVGDGAQMMGFAVEGYLYGGGVVESQKGDGVLRGGPLEYGFDDEIKQWWTVQQHDLCG